MKVHILQGNQASNDAHSIHYFSEVDYEFRYGKVGDSTRKDRDERRKKREQRKGGARGEIERGRKRRRQRRRRQRRRRRNRRTRCGKKKDGGSSPKSILDLSLAIMAVILGTK